MVSTNVWTPVYLDCHNHTYTAPLLSTATPPKQVYLSTLAEVAVMINCCMAEVMQDKESRPSDKDSSCCEINYTPSNSSLSSLFSSVNTSRHDWCTHNTQYKKYMYSNCKRNEIIIAKQPRILCVWN